MSYRAYVGRKLVLMAITIFLVTSLNFYLIQVLPGDPARTILPRGGCNLTNITNQCDLINALHKEWGLDKPLYMRYLIYMGNVFQGNWGTSITFRPGHSVWEIILPRVSTTLVFIGTGTLISIWLGMKVGVFTGWRRGKFADSSVAFLSLLTYSVPTFWLGLAFVLWFAVDIPLFPVSGVTSLSTTYNQMSLFGQLADRAWHAVLPLSVFIINNYAIFTLIMRSSLMEQLEEDYMVTAKAKGLKDHLLLKRHAIPNARLPVVTTIALYIGWIFSGAIVIEVVFDLPGIGLLTWDAVRLRDYPLMSAIFLLGTLGVVVANTVTDIFYSYLDPRVTEA